MNILLGYIKLHEYNGIERRIYLEKLKVAWIPIIGVIISIATLALASYNTHYITKGTKESSKWNSVFYVNKKEAIINTQKHWAKGKIYYGLYHYKGPTKTKYSIYYKKGNDKSYKLHYSGSLAKNKKYYGDYLMHSTNGKDKYAYKLLKKSNLNKQTRMKVEFGRK